MTTQESGSGPDQKPGLFKPFRFAPVAWASTALVLINAALGANELPGAHVIPERVMPYVLFADALLAAILGRAAHARVTPLADPRDNDGEPLHPIR